MGLDRARAAVSDRAKDEAGGDRRAPRAGPPARRGGPRRAPGPLPARHPGWRPGGECSTRLAGRATAPRFSPEPAPRVAVGVDIDERTGDACACALRRRVRVGDVASLPFEDGAFDLVVSFETIEHVDDPEGTLDEFARVLADAGLLLISTPNKQRVPGGEPVPRPRVHARGVRVRCSSGAFPAVRALLPAQLADVCRAPSVSRSRKRATQAHRPRCPQDRRRMSPDRSSTPSLCVGPAWTWRSARSR